MKRRTFPKSLRSEEKNTITTTTIITTKYGGHSPGFAHGLLFVTFWSAEEARVNGSSEPCILLSSGIKIKVDVRDTLAAGCLVNRM